MGVFILSSLRELITQLAPGTIAIETTSGKQVRGEIAAIGDDFVAVKVHTAHDVADVVPFSSIAEIRSVPESKLLP